MSPGRQVRHYPGVDWQVTHGEEQFIQIFFNDTIIFYYKLGIYEQSFTQVYEINLSLLIY